MSTKFTILLPFTSEKERNLIEIGSINTIDKNNKHNYRN